MTKIKSKYFQMISGTSPIKVRVNYEEDTKKIVGSKKTGLDRFAKYLDHMKSDNITL